MFGAKVKHVVTPCCTIWILINEIMGRNICPSESDGQVYWPDTASDNCVRSDPFCLNENMEIVSRCCSSEGKWKDEVICTSHQVTIANPCPEQFDWKSDICIFVIEDSIYPPQCPYEENLPFSRYVSVLDSQVFPIWMPVERNSKDYGPDLMRWIEPAPTYKQPYNDYYFEGSEIGKDCLIYHNTLFAEAVSCDERHTAICAYQNLPNRLRSFCSQSYPQGDLCVQSDYSTRSKCFCQGHQNGSSLAQLHEPYQNLLYSSLNATCYIGLEKVNGSYLWKNSNTNIEYSNWAETASFSDDYKYGAITADGWVMLKTQNETDCVLHETQIPRSYSSIALDYTQEHFVLKLTNANSWLFEEYNSTPMVFCFTDASTSSLISKVYITSSTIMEDEAQFYFQKLADGPGNYWCEAFLYPGVNVRTSNRYLLRYNESYTEEYVVILNKSYAQGTNPISERSMYEYQQLLANQVQSFPNVSHFHVRIFKIVNVDEENLQITINFHVANPNLSKSLTYYSDLSAYVENQLTDFTFVRILDVDNCVGVQSSHAVTWPVAPINTVVRPREGFCIGSDGFIVNRRCFGNYIDGAKWLDLEVPCTVQPYTNATVNLTNIVNMNSSSEYMEQVIDITKNNLDLLARDIELISCFFEQITYSTSINLTSVSIITNQLMEVPKKILRESQAASNATDRILYQLHDIIDQSSYVDDVAGENFYIIIAHAKDCNLTAIVVQEDDIYKVCNVSNLNDILKISGLKAAVFLSENLQSQFLEEDALHSKIIVTIYKNSNLFNEIDRWTKNTGLIFGITFPYVQDVRGEMLTVYKTSSSEDVSCSYWDLNLNEKTGYWVETQRSNSTDFVICTYDEPKHFTLVRNEINVTRELEILIKSQDVISEKLNETFLLLKDYYRNFQPVDLDLVSELLHMAVQANEDNLELVTDIINVIVDIPKEVLEESQRTYNATVKILYYFDQILQNCGSSHVVQRNNVYVVVQFLNEDLFYGFIIDQYDGEYHFSLIKEETTSEVISQVRNLDTALLISGVMVDQLLQYKKQNYEPKIVSAVFFKDSLFIKDYCNPRIHTKVVGVYFPNFDDPNQNGDIILLYNFNSNVFLNYTCAVYVSDTEESSNIIGSWNRENPSVFKNGIQVCEFWKPTYFSLLLVNLTAHLESMLNSTEYIEAILQSTSFITSNYYEYLQPIDIYLIAQLLSRVKEVNESVLELSSTIVNDVMKVSSSVLRSSQEIYNATNTILYSFNNIAGAYNKTKEIYKQHILLIVSLLEETGMYGIRLENCSEICNPFVLFNNSTYFPNAALSKSDVELTLNSNLINNLVKAKNEEYIPKLVLLIFYSNKLFIESNGSRNTSQIFGIYFPGFDKNLSGEIRLALQPTVTSSSDYNCVSWIYQDQSVDNIEGIWTYESRPRNTDTLTCNFYDQNYFAMVDGTRAVENVTHALDSILNSSISFLAKLYRAQDISYYYMDFLPYDIYQFSAILMQCVNLNDDGLDMVSAIINNILRTSQEVLLASVHQHDALRKILQSINHISNFEDSRQYSLLNDQFGLVVCQLHSNSSNGVILTAHDIKCTYEVDDDTFAHSENVIASLILSKGVVQTTEGDENPKIVVSIFSNNIFFNMDETQNSTLIVGLSIPNVQEKLEGDVVVLYNNSLYNKSKYACGVWENLDNWKVKNGANLDLFIKCRYSEATYFTVWETPGNDDPVTITHMLEGIINTNCTPSEKLILTLEVVRQYLEEFEAYHVHLVTRILSFVEKADSSSLETAVNIISNITNLPRQTLANSQDEYDATDLILYHIDRITESVEDPVKIETENMVVINRYNISGIYVENCNGNCSVGILIDVNYTTLCKNINTALVFDNILQSEIQKDSSLQVVITVYFKNSLFNEDNSVTYTNVGPIIGIAIPSQSEKLNGSLMFYYYTKTNNPKACAFWNYTVDGDTVTKGSWQKNRPLIQPADPAICESKQATHFALLQLQPNVTNDLEYILNSNSTAQEKLEELIAIMSDTATRLRPVDIYLISKILEQALEQVDIDKVNITSAIISSLFQVPRNILRESQLAYYATDKILHTVEEMSKQLSSLTANIDPIIQDNFTVAIYDLKETNASGLLLENCSSTQCSISLIEGTVNLTELVRNENMQTAIALSDELLEQVRQDEGSPKLAVSIYFSDVLFNEQTERDGKVSMVCGILLPGFNATFLGSLYVLFNGADNVDYSNNSCASWNFKVQNGEEIIEGSWRSEVDPRTKEHFTICEYDHITHFALLLTRDDSNFAEANKYNILDIITAINSVLSIIGIFGILLTAALFERWRRNTGNQILIHFSIAMSIKTIMLYVSAGVYDEHMRVVVCYVTGAILHFAILSEFCWMLIIAILQFKRFVEVLGGPPKFVLLKACICGWVFPILPVMLILIIDKQNYSEGSVGLCYPSGLGLYLGVWLPLIIIVTINFVIFIFIIYNVFHKKTESRDIVNHEILFQWRLALLLFSMLGLTWLFGFMSQIPGAENIFVYLFCFSATLQGFIMFMFFIVFNKSTRFLYSQSIKMWLYSKGYKMH